MNRMLNFGNKEFRNIQEQVLKNANDIEDLIKGQHVLDEFGIKVLGVLEDPAQLPESGYEYGDAYAIGLEPPYDIYVWTRSVVEGQYDGWFNIGRFPEPGPQGPQGEKGEKGDVGESTKWTVGTYLPVNVKEGDLHLDVRDGTISQYKNGRWEPKGSIRGPQGPAGPRGFTGERGPEGPQGPQGPRGDVGGFINIRGTLSYVSQLPDPAELGDPTAAYLVGDSKELYIQVGESAESRTWLNAGVLNVGTYVTDNGDFQNVYEVNVLANKGEINTFTKPQVIANKIDIRHEPQWDGDADSTLTVQNDGWSAHLGINGASMYIGGRFEFDKSVAPVGSQDLGASDAKWNDMHLTGKINLYTPYREDATWSIEENEYGGLYYRLNGNTAYYFDGGEFANTNNGNLGSPTNRWKDFNLNGKIDFGTKIPSRTTSCYIDTDAYDGIRFYANNVKAMTMYDNATYLDKPLYANNSNVDLGDDSTHKFRNLYLSNDTYIDGITKYQWSTTTGNGYYGIGTYTNDNNLYIYNGANRMLTIGNSAIRPVGSNTNYDIGLSSLKFRNLYLKGSIQIGNTTINESQLQQLLALLG